MHIPNGIFASVFPTKVQNVFGVTNEENITVEWSPFVFCIEEVLA
jgi:hypothetical protein